MLGQWRVWFMRGECRWAGALEQGWGRFLPPALCFAPGFSTRSPYLVDEALLRGLREHFALPSAGELTADVVL